MIVYPEGCITEASKLAFCVRLDELNRLAHNAQGDLFRVGAITQAEWDTFRSGTFTPKMQAIQHEMNIQRAAVAGSSYWPADLGVAVVV